MCQEFAKKKVLPDGCCLLHGCVIMKWCYKEAAHLCHCACSWSCLFRVLQLDSHLEELWHLFVGQVKFLFVEQRGENGQVWSCDSGRVDLWLSKACQINIYLNASQDVAYWHWLSQSHGQKRHGYILHHPVVNASQWVIQQKDRSETFSFNWNVSSKIFQCIF